jgi:hypothetical protein
MFQSVVTVMPGGSFGQAALEGGVDAGGGEGAVVESGAPSFDEPRVHATIVAASIAATMRTDGTIRLPAA